ncbi:MAG: cobalamin B12-binding domain-containing protein [Candidatus Caldatribacteriota bacterium]|jgi:methylmalonyl-CoA mutase C-terminal domain/subunit|nr:cobalamin B12-binding domain-containing protein [Atribacterota bacterium]MDD3031150.1 cobalamin B12-binding domain-containing protein [Atribacterota bacterium]MDD3640434.1 cobalamin B12-binding domain-containing protein [Atribacterota bacterium]MDD4288853.1 cobalamin B12-binding domain-containing protein [Atribacterota bacterium]MDI9597797.1 cobalamin B12-binding domain-containing protein [Atribacterota bacterium]
MSKTRIRVLVAKPGLDGHDRGAKVIARALRDAGMEVIYTGLRQTPEQIIEAAVQEDVNVIGLSILSGAHMYLFPKITDMLKERKMTDILVIAGGIIPAEDIVELNKMGIKKVFTPGTDTKEIVDFIKKNIAVA